MGEARWGLLSGDLAASEWQPSIQGGRTPRWSARAGQAGRRQAWFGPCPSLYVSSTLLVHPSFPFSTDANSTMETSQTLSKKMTTCYQYKELARQDLN